MPSIIGGALAASLGFLLYLLVAFLGFVYPIDVRVTVGEFYLKQMARCFKQFTFIRRVLSSYDVLPISVDAEKKLLKVSLSSSSLPGKDDKEFEFTDPDDRIKRLYKKPVAIAYEEVPAALDAELAEIGHWVREKDVDEGLVTEAGDSKTADPYVEMDDTPRIVDPVDAFEVVANAVTPENIKTAEEITRKRYEKYGSRIGLAETMGTLMGFAAGIMGVAVLKYIKQNLLDSTGGGAPDVSIPLGWIQPAVDAVVMLI